MELKDSLTKQNLKQAFDFVAKRSTEYDIYALIAEREGNTELQKLLTMFSQMEKEHAKVWFKWLNDGNIPELTTCLENALIQERNEVEGIYETYTKQAKEEGFDHIAGLFEKIEAFEITHIDRLKKVITKLKDNVPANDDGTYNWVCSVCGCVFKQKEAPNHCPICVKENVFFYKSADENE